MPVIVPASRFCRACRVVLLAVACTAGLVASEGHSDDGPNSAAAILEAKGLIEGVEASLAADRPKRAAADFKAAADAVEALLALPRPPAGVRPLLDRLRKIKERLELEEADVSEVIVPFAKSSPKPKAAAAPKPSGPSMDAQPGFTRPTKAAAAGVSFSRDVAPMLVNHCGGCHVSGRKGGFQMASFDALMRSGLVQAGNSQASRLVEVIQSGDMPRGGGRVPPNEMAMLMTWIDSGAASDGKDQSASLESLAAAGRAAKLSHEDLREVRYAAGGRFWSRVIPDERGISARGDDVLVVGNLTQAEIDEVAERAEKLVRKLHGEYGLDEDEPLSKGGCVVFVCRKSYDYSSFWQTILGKEKPAGFVCHAGLAGDLLYGACVMPKDGLEAEDEITAELAEQLATAAWLSRGAPEWFATGAGKLAAVMLAAKAASVMAAGSRRAATPSPPAEVFLGRDIDPGERAAVSRRFVGDLAGRGKLTSLVAAMKKTGAGPDGFSKAFANVFGGPPEAVYAAWVGGSGRR